MILFWQIHPLQLKRVWGSFINGCVCFVIFLAFRLPLENIFPHLESELANQIALFITYATCLFYTYLKPTSFMHGALGLTQYDLYNGKKIGFAKHSLKITIIYFLFIIISQLGLVLLSLLFFLPFGSLITAFDGQYTVIDRLLGIKVLDRDIDLSEKNLSNLIFHLCSLDIAKFVDQNETMKYDSNEVYILSTLTSDNKFEMFKSVDFHKLKSKLNDMDYQPDHLEDDLDLYDDDDIPTLGDDILYALKKKCDFFDNNTLDWLNQFTPENYTIVLDLIEKISNQNMRVEQTKINILQRLTTEQLHILLNGMSNESVFYPGASLLKPIKSYNSFLRRVRKYLL